MNISKINELIDAEIELAKGSGTPQFIKGLQQAKKVINDYKPEKCSACGGSGYYKDGYCGACDGTGYEE